MSKHTLSVRVENKPGVLARVAGLFGRRGINIESLAVRTIECDQLLHMTIVVDADRSQLEQITKQLDKLINVLEIVELESAGAVGPELQPVSPAAVSCRAASNIVSR